MDVNGTHFHLLLGARDWLPRLADANAPADERVAWDPQSGHVTLRRELFRFPPRPAEAPFTPDHRRGSAQDRFGHFYWIAADGHAIRYRPRDDSASAELWSASQLTEDTPPAPPASGAFVACAPPPLPAPPRLRGLAVTERHFLVAGTLEPAGLLVFDLHGGGPPVWLRWPDAVPFAPFDLEAAPGGGLWVLDREAAGVARLWRLDRDLRVVRAGDDVEIAPPPPPDAFRPVDPGPDDACVPRPRTFPNGITLDLASPPIPAGGDPLSVVALPDGSALVMSVDAAAGDTHLLRWVLGGWHGGGSPPAAGAELLGAPASLAAALSTLLDEPAALVGHDMAIVSDDAPEPGLVTGTLYVADVAGNQSVAFAISTGIRGTAESAALDVTALASYYPMRRWAGKALVSGGNRETYYDLADAWLPLTELPRPRYAPRGVLDAVVLDGKEPGCVWHRLMLDACIPPGDVVDVESRAADEEDELASLPWRSEPALRLRPGGPELPWVRPAHADPPPGAGTWELLFQGAVGRYVELRLTLRGSGRSSPKIAALRAHYPRFSYLRYLPDVYREDASAASFLDRFLANFEGLFSELEGRVAAAEVLFDHAAAPPDALAWLGEWLGEVFDDSWDEGRRRLFLEHAAELYRRRGTRRGLLAAVRLATDACPRGDGLFADDDGDRPFGVRLSEAFRQGDPGGAHRFTVLAPVDLSAPPVRRFRVRESIAAIVERERPAHAAFDVQLYWALFRVGAARVGQDTALGEGSRFSALVLGAGYLGQSLVAERHPWDIQDRRVVGRDRDGFPPPLG